MRGRASERTYLRRLLPRFAACLAVGLCLPGRQLLVEEAFVGAPSAVGRLRGSHGGGSPQQRAAEADGGSGSSSSAGEEDADALRARVAELEKKLEAKSSQEAAPAPAYEESDAAVAALKEMAQRQMKPVNPVVQAAWEAIFKDLKDEFVKVKDGQTELMSGVQMKVGAEEDGSTPAIYRRKYDLLGASMKGQEAYLKAIRRTVKMAKEMPSVKSFVELIKDGRDGLDRRQVARENEKLSRQSREANMFINEILPGVLEDPIADSLNALGATILIIVALTAIVCCFLPPIPPPED